MCIVTRIAAMRIIFTRIGCTLLTCDVYMSDLRHIHDPVLLSLKMEGIRLLFCQVFEVHTDSKIFPPEVLSVCHIFILKFGH
jgi:hypothetical protein